MRFLPRAGGRREPRSTVVAVSGSRPEPTSVSTAVPGSCLKPTLPRPAALWNAAGRGNVGSVPVGNTAGGWDMGSIPRVDTAMRIDVGFELRIRADRPCSASRKARVPKFFPTNLKFGLARGRRFPYIIPCACGLSAVGSAPPCQGGGRGFEPRSPLHVSTEAGHSGLFHMAKWPSGKAGACKALTPGSNPGFASRK